MRDRIFDGSVFQPDTMLPDQYFSEVRRRSVQEPAVRLVMAILQDAVECFQKHVSARDRKSRKLFEDAREWIFTDERTWPYSFVNVCLTLNLNPDWVRAGLKEWQDRHVRRAAAEISSRSGRELEELSAEAG